MNQFKKKKTFIYTLASVCSNFLLARYYSSFPNISIKVGEYSIYVQTSSSLLSFIAHRSSRARITVILPFVADNTVIRPSETEEEALQDKFVEYCGRAHAY